MDYFSYKNTQLYAEDIAVSDIVKEIPTPFYLYSKATFLHHVAVLKEALKGCDALIAFAVKANSNIAVLHLLGKAGLGADTVSKGEIKRALKAGINPQKIVFSGVGKRADEIVFALENNIKQINVESDRELYLIEEIAQKLGKIAPIAFRVNPDVKADTLSDITTGAKENKFGISYDKIEALYGYAHKSPFLKTEGLATHIGSQIIDVVPFQQAWAKIAVLIKNLKNQGFDVPCFDLGGGLGIPYGEGDAHLLPLEWGAAVKEIAQQSDCKIIVEPGRMIAGNAGIMVSRILFNKTEGEREFVIVDAGMNDLMRPAMYKAKHAIIPLKQTQGQERKVDVVGPICETTDLFDKDFIMPALEEGEYIAFRTAGAYGAVMSNSYNSRSLPAEILVDGDKFHIIRRPIDIDEIISWDSQGLL